MRRLAIRWRLTLAFGAVMAILLGSTGAFVHQRLASNLDGAINSALRARTADVTALAQQSESGLKETANRPAGARRVQFAQLIDESNRVIDTTPSLSSRPLLSRADLNRIRATHGLRTDVVIGDEPVRLAATAIRAQNQNLVVVVGQSLENRDSALHDLRNVLLVGGPIALVLACLAGYVLTGAALRPVDDMRRQAATMSATNLSGRLTPPQRNDEIGRLGQTLNDLLTRVQSAVDRERTFVSDASHELRSPLSMLHTELELIARDLPTGPELQTAVNSAISETARLSHLADDLLLLARADEDQVAIRAARIPARELLDDAAARARSQGQRPDLRITVNADDDAVVHADGVRVAQALDNLMTNATRYAKTAIELTAIRQGDSIDLHVLDDGPGFPAAFLPDAWKRFARADTARTEDGAGLGLAIVQTVAKLHGSSADAANRDTGGADVWIRLPAAT